MSCDVQQHSVCGYCTVSTVHQGGYAGAGGQAGREAKTALCGLFELQGSDRTVSRLSTEHDCISPLPHCDSNVTDLHTQQVAGKVWLIALLALESYQVCSTSNLHVCA